MARDLKFRDAHVLINAVADEMFGKNAHVTAIDPSTFVSVGESILASTTESTLNAIAIVLGRRMVSARPYKSNFRLIRAINSGIYSNRMSKISIYSQGAEADGSTNNQLTTNLKTGFDNGTNAGVATESQWYQKQALVAEFFFGGSNTWQDVLTRYEDVLQSAFRDESSFLSFMNGIMIEKMNDIESQKEAFDRITLLNYIGGLYDLSTSMNGSAVNLRVAYNDEYGTNYTVEDLLGAHRAEFYAFFVAYIKNLTGYFTERSVNYHWSVPKVVDNVTYHILRHTPKNKQKLILLEKFWNNAQATVMPEIFNPNYLSIDNFQTIGFWQNENEREKVSVTPAIPNVSDPTQQTTGDPVTIPYVLGVLFDEDALMTDYQLEKTRTTNVESRKGYANTWWTFRRGAINDFTEKGCLLYLAD